MQSMLKIHLMLSYFDKNIPWHLLCYLDVSLTTGCIKMNGMIFTSFDGLKYPLFSILHHELVAKLIYWPHQRIGLEYKLDLSCT